MTEELDLWSQFRLQVHYARVVALGIIIGGLLGYLVHQIQPPVYEAVAVMSVNLDTTQVSSEVELTEYDKDQLLGTTGTTLISSPVVEKTMDRLKAKGIQLSSDTLYQSCAIERRQNEWLLKCRFSDPQTAQTVSNIWMQTAYETMIDLKNQGLLVNYLIVMPPNDARLPDSPIAYDRKKMMFAGLTLGFVAGIAVNTWLINRKKNSPLQTHA